MQYGRTEWSQFVIATVVSVGMDAELTASNVNEAAIRS